TVTERRHTVGVDSSRAGGLSLAVAERRGAVTVGGGRASGAAVGIAERGRVLRRRCRDRGEREHGDGECLHESFSLLRKGAPPGQPSAVYRCPFVSLVALLTWRDLLSCAKELFIK